MARFAAHSRSSVLSTLLLAFIGSASTMRTWRGTLKLAMVSRAHATSSSGSGRVPAAGTTNAMPTSPMRSSGTPITATCAIVGWRSSSRSISAG